MKRRFSEEQIIGILKEQEAGHARRVLADWKDDYNHARPHSGLGGLTPPKPRPRRKQGWGMPQPCLPSPPASGQNHTGLNP